MRLTSLGIVALVISACSSACSSSSGSDCTIAGTYTVTATKETGTCDRVYADVLGAVGDSATYTITAAPDEGANTYAVKLQGLQNACVFVANGCKMDGACDLTTTGNGQGTYQVSWTFDAKGFSGLETTTLPNLTDTSGKQRAACGQTDRSTGTRR